MDQLIMYEKGKTFDVYIPQECDLEKCNKVIIRGKEFVPVVRCKDCRFGKALMPNRVNCHLFFDEELLMYDNDFCSNGERREE